LIAVIVALGVSLIFIVKEEVEDGEDGERR
jgi:hypothetical protein